MNTIGFIGCGRIGGAMLKRLAGKGGDFTLLAHDHNQGKIDLVNRYVSQLQSKHKEASKNTSQTVAYVSSIAELIQKSDYIILAIQRKSLPTFFDEITEHLTEDKVLISAMTAITSQTIRARTSYIAPVVRIIPTIAVAYGKGVVGVSYPREVTENTIKNKLTYFISDAQKDFIKKLLHPLGQINYLSEDKLSIFTAIVACAPAYTFFLMEAMLQAALSMGISYTEAKRAIATSVEGSAYLGRLDAQSFADLRLHTSTPKSVSFQAINEMEASGVRGGIINALISAEKHCVSMHDRLE